MKKIIAIVLLTTISYGISLNESIEKLKKQNLEIKNTEYQIKNLNEDIEILKSKYYGTLDVEINALRSNDPGNVFGFKLASGEASFKDFGFEEFLNPLGQMLNGQFVDQNQLLNTKPNDLNNPNATNLFQTNIKYTLPLYTGGILENYESITKRAKKISQIKKEEQINEKIYQLKSSFNNYKMIEVAQKEMKTIESNIKRFIKTVKRYKEEGYAKEVDVLEVMTKMYEVERIIYNLESNKKLIKHYVSFLLNEKITSIETKGVIERQEEKKEISNNSNIKKVKEAIKIQEKMVEVKRGDYLPKIGLITQISNSTTEINSNYVDTPKYTIGIGLKWNIYNGGITKREIEKEKVNYLKMKNNLQIAKEGIKLKLNQINTEINNLKMQEKTLVLEYQKDNLIYDSYKKRYKERLVSINEVLMKQSELISKYIKLNQIQTLKNNKILEYNKIIGR